MRCGMRPGVVAVVVGLMVIVGCGPAAPAPAPVASSAAQPAAGAAAGQATPAGDAAYRQQVIDAARSEGEVNVALQSAWTPEAFARSKTPCSASTACRSRST